jgi:ankyrin repeat protein
VKTSLAVWLWLMLTSVLGFPHQDGSGIDVELVRAARAGEASFVGDLLGRGARVNARVLFGDGLGTAISEAAAGGFSNIVQMLVRAGAAVNLIDNNGWTALMSANNRDVIRVLVDDGAGLDAMDVNGWTALMLLDDLDLAAVLLAEGKTPMAGRR